MTDFLIRFRRVFYPSRKIYYFEPWPYILWFFEDTINLSSLGELLAQEYCFEFIFFFVEANLLMLRLLLIIFSSIVIVAGKYLEREKPKLLVVSFDGFRWDYLDRIDVRLKNFEKFLENGVRAEVKYWYKSFLYKPLYIQFMKNQFQTKTFPNHWTMVTGLYEESHGIIGGVI